MFQKLHEEFTFLKILSFCGNFRRTNYFAKAPAKCCVIPCISQFLTKLVTRNSFQFFHTTAFQLHRWMHVNIQCNIYSCMAEDFTQGLNIHTAFHTSCGKCMPLRYNNDKQKKPLFSRGLSVCRLLFNSFSKLKIDENYKEKRRLFY